jgi:hypothetical protein
MSQKLFIMYFFSYYVGRLQEKPVTVAEWSKACIVFARSEAGIVDSNPTQCMNVYYVYLFILCLRCPVFRQRPCDELITR